MITRWVKMESSVRMWERYKEVLAEGLAFDRSYEKLISVSRGKQRDCIAIQVLQVWWDEKEVERVYKQSKRKATVSKKTPVFQPDPPKSRAGRVPLPTTTREFKTEATYFEPPDSWMAWQF